MTLCVGVVGYRRIGPQRAAVAQGRGDRVAIVAGVLNKWPRKNGCELASFSRRLKAICNPQSAIRNQLEDNAFTLLRTADGRMAQFHTSWTQRKN
jgi:hypothetical protein